MNSCTQILDRQLPINPKPAPQNELNPPSLQLTLDAYEAWIQFYNSLEKKLGKGMIYHSIHRFGSKAGEHVLRIAGVLSVFEKYGTSYIEKTYIDRAIRIINYYLDEHKRLENYSLVDPTLKTAQRVVDWMSRNESKAILLSDLYQYGPSEVRSKNKALTILDVLKNHGRVFPVPAGDVKSGAKGIGWCFV